MKRIVALGLTILLLLACGCLPAQASIRPIAAKAFTVKNVVYLDIAAGSIEIGAKYVSQAGEIFAHKNKLVLTGTSTANTVSVSAGANVTVTIDNLCIQSTTASPFSIAPGAQARLILAGRNILRCNSGAQAYAALGVPEGASVTISGSGALWAVGITGAGIGGGVGSAGGTITITGGAVEARSTNGAGIGGGWNGAGGTIRITGGTVNAHVTGEGAGIGGGWNGAGGNITITGGTVNAHVTGEGAGIGGGWNGAGGNITITGGTVNAKSDISAGIGAGWNGAGGNITITGGKVTASGHWGAGIGGGESGVGGVITITGGTVTASGHWGAGIGTGLRGSGGTVTIAKNAVKECSGIGAENVTLNKATIKAQSVTATGTLTLTGKNTLNIGNWQAGSRVDFALLAGKGTLTCNNIAAYVPVDGAVVAQGTTDKKQQAQFKLGGGFQSRAALWDAQGAWSIDAITQADAVYLVVGKKKQAMSYESAVAAIDANPALKANGKVTQAKIVLRRNVDTDASTMPHKPCTIDGQGFFKWSIRHSILDTNVHYALTGVTVQNASSDPCPILSGASALTLRNATVGSIEAENATVTVSGTNTISGIHAKTLQLNKARLLDMASGIQVSEALQLTGANRMHLTMNGMETLVLSGAAKSTGKGTLTLDPEGEAANLSQIVYMSAKQSPAQAHIKLDASLSKYALTTDENKTNYRLTLKDASAVRVTKGKTSAGYSTLAEAAEYINQKKLSGATVTLNQDITQSDTLTFSYPVTIDLGKHTLRAGNLNFQKNATIRNGTFNAFVIVSENVTITARDCPIRNIRGDGTLYVQGAFGANTIDLPKITLNKAQVTMRNTYAQPVQRAVEITLIGMNAWSWENADATTPTKGLTMKGSGKLTIDSANAVVFAADGGVIDPGVINYLVPGEALAEYRLVYTPTAITVRKIF